MSQSKPEPPSTRSFEPSRSVPNDAPQMPDPTARFAVVQLLYCPFPSEINPHAESAERETNRWIREQHLFSQEQDYHKFTILHAGLLAARTTPRATPERLQLITDWCSWFFVRDDYCDESGMGHDPKALAHLHTRFLKILNGAPLTPDDTPLARALQELWQRTTPFVSENWQHRFFTHLEDFFEAGVWEANNRRSGEVPALEIYLEMRPYSGGVFAYIDLLEISEQSPLPAEIQAHPVTQALCAIVANIVSWANDLVSLPKEIHQGEIHNLVLSLQLSQGEALQPAITQAIELHNREMELYLQKEQEFLALAGAETSSLAEYAAALRALMRGSLDWFAMSGRYPTKGTIRPTEK